MSRDIVLIALGWAIPTLLAWLASQIPAIKDRPMILFPIFTVIIGVTFYFAVIHMESKLKGVIAFAPSLQNCTENYSNKGQIVLLRHFQAPDRYIKPGDKTGTVPTLDDWPPDIATLCIHD